MTYMSAGTITEFQSITELKTLIGKIQNTFIVRDNQGHNMTLEYFDVNRII